MSLQFVSKDKLPPLTLLKNELPPLEYTLPHSGKMLLIQERLEWEPGRGVCSCVLKNDAHYMSKDGFKAHWLIEIIAQAIAVTAGTEVVLEGVANPNSFGFLVAVDQFSVQDTFKLKEGSILILEAQRIFHYPPSSVYEACAWLDSTKIAKGVFKTFFQAGNNQ